MRRPKLDETDGDDPVGPKRRQSSEVALSPTVLSISSWALDEEPERPLMLVLPGPSHLDRLEVLRQFQTNLPHLGIVVDSTRSVEWLEGSFANSFLRRVLHLPMPDVSKGIMAPWYPMDGLWALLWNLIAVEEFVIEEPLRALVDKPFYLVHDVHRALWEARFLAREHGSLDPAKEFMVHFTRWLVNDPLGEEGRRVLSGLGLKRFVTKDAEKFDVACFLLALACQNNLLERSVFYFDDLERGLQPNRRSNLRHLRDLLDCGRRWSRLGNNPFAVLLGFTGTRADMQLLTRLNSALAVDVSEGLSRVHRTLSS